MKIQYLIICFLFISINSFAQNESSKLGAYMKNFNKGDTQVKLQLIEEAAGLESPALGPLFKSAVDYAVSNSSQLNTDNYLKRFSIIAVNECADLNVENAKYPVLRLFNETNDFALQEATLKALAVLGKTDSAIITNLNNYLENQNNIYKTGKIPNKKIVAVCLKTLAELDDASSFTPIFNTMILGYDRTISALAYKTLLNLAGEFSLSIFSIIKNGTTVEKMRALEVGLGHQTMEVAKKAEFAEYALDIALHYTTASPEDRKMIREIRDTATEALSGYKWGKATGLIISQFDTVLLEYEHGVAPKNSVLLAINALGNMGTHAAAQRLTLYLNILNAYTENKKKHDTQIMLAVIYNLGKLGDKIAYDDLMYIKYLSYSGEIKAAAQKAIKNLKW